MSRAADPSTAADLSTAAESASTVDPLSVAYEIASQAHVQLVDVQRNFDSYVRHTIVAVQYLLTRLKDHKRLDAIPAYPGRMTLHTDLIPHPLNPHPPLLQLGWALNAQTIPVLLRKAKQLDCLRRNGKYLDLYSTMEAVLHHYAGHFELDLDFCGVRGGPLPGSPEFHSHETRTWFVSVWNNHDSEGCGYGYPPHLRNRILDFSKVLYGDNQDHVPSWQLDFQWIPGYRVFD